MDVFLEENNINQYSSKKYIMEGVALYCIKIQLSFYRLIYLKTDWRGEIIEEL